MGDCATKRVKRKVRSVSFLHSTVAVAVVHKEIEWVELYSEVKVSPATLPMAETDRSNELTEALPSEGAIPHGLFCNDKA